MKSKGFTLIELLVSMSVASVIIAFIFYILFTSIMTYDRISKSAKSIDTVVFVIDKMNNDILQSQAIAQWSNENRIVLLQNDGNVTYQYKNNKLSRQKRSDVSYLTVEGEIKKISFLYISSGVKVTIVTAGGENSFTSYPRDIQ